MRNRRQRPGRVVLDTIVGLKPIDMGDYLQAIGYLVRYRNYGGRIRQQAPVLLLALKNGQTGGRPMNWNFTSVKRC